MINDNRFDYTVTYRATDDGDRVIVHCEFDLNLLGQPGFTPDEVADGIGRRLTVVQNLLRLPAGDE